MPWRHAVVETLGRDDDDNLNTAGLSCNNFWRQFPAEMRIALPEDVPPWLSELIAVVTGAIFPQDIAKSKSPNLGPFLKELTLKS